jgi:hypothetical protein
VLALCGPSRALLPPRHRGFRPNQIPQQWRGPPGLRSLRSSGPPLRTTP